MTTTRPILSLTLFVLFSCLSGLLMATPRPDSEQGTLMRTASEERLAPCPKSPNCVNSAYFQDKNHYILPLAIHAGEGKSKMDVLLETLNQFERIKIVMVEDNYLKVEFKSRFLGFVDDVEFVIHDEHTDVRSASRTGYHDLGVNRRRIEKIRQALPKPQAGTE